MSAKTYRRGRGSVLHWLCGIAAVIALVSTTSCRSRSYLVADGTTAAHELTVTIERVPQEKPNWCWAACAQMIHAAHGRTFTQHELEQHVQGTQDDPDGQAAVYRELLIALAPDIEPDVLVHLRDEFVQSLLQGHTKVEVDPLGIAWAQVAHYAVNSDSLVEALRGGSPGLVVLDEGPDVSWEHAYVANGVGYGPSKGGILRRYVQPATVHFGDLTGRPAEIAEEALLDYDIVWIDLIDPDPAAVEDVQPSVDVPSSAPPAFLRLGGSELADRVRLILTPAAAEQILQDRYKLIRSKGSASNGAHR